MQVSLGLLHGTQPDVIVMCHEAGRDRVAGMEHFATPSLPEAIAITLLLARRTNRLVRCAGVALNTAKLDPTQAYMAIGSTRAQLGLPVADPIRGGLALEQLVDACLEAGA